VGFYLSPCVAGKVFKGAPGLFTKRMPISERAAQAYKKAVLPNVDWKLCRKDSFKIGTSTVRFLNESGNVEAHVIPTVISHLVPIFENKDIDVLIKDIDKYPPIFSIHAYEVGSMSDEKHFSLDPDKYPLASLNFCVSGSDKRIYLNVIVSQCHGFGGKMVTALYNIAKDLRFRKISFEANPKNQAACRFYFHMDFGRPVKKILNQWEVDVRNDPARSQKCQVPTLKLNISPSSTR